MKWIYNRWTQNRRMGIAPQDRTPGGGCARIRVPDGVKLLEAGKQHDYLEKRQPTQLYCRVFAGDAGVRAKPRELVGQTRPGASQTRRESPVDCHRRARSGLAFVFGDAAEAAAGYENHVRRERRIHSGRHADLTQSQKSVRSQLSN